MVDPDQGLKIDSIYRFPANALVTIPKLWLFIGGIGLLLVVLAPHICGFWLYPMSTKTELATVCRSSWQWAGFGLAAAGFGVYLLVRVRRSRADRGG